MKKLLQWRVILPYLSGWIFIILAWELFDIYWLKSGFLILFWGAGAFLGVCIRKRDPSWNWIFITSLAFFLFGFFLFFPEVYLRQLCSILTVPISITYFSSKIICSRNGCCRARRTNRFFNPVRFKTFNWLQNLECVLTVINMVIATSFLFAGNLQLSFFIFLLTHFAIRFISYYFRNPKFNYFKHLFRSQSLFVLLFLIIYL